MSRSGPGLLELLVNHGVSDRAGRLYLVACRAGPQSASELARLAGVDRVESYRLIQTLVGEGLLVPTATRPKRFAPLPPERLIDRWISRHTERLRVLEHDRQRILDEWEAGEGDPEEDDPRKFAVLEGREAIRRFLKTRLGTARKEILITATGSWLPLVLDAGLDRTLREAKARGVQIRFVTDVGPSNLPAAKHLATVSTLRHASVPVPTRTVVLDGSGALVYVSGEAGLGRAPDEQVALWSAEPGFVRMTREFHRRLWNSAERSEERFVDLEEPSSAVLPVIAGKETVPFQRLKEITKLGMRASGVRELRLDLPELIGTVARQLGREIASEIEGATPADVAKSLSRYYSAHTMGALSVVKDKPLTLRVTGCFACTPDSPEIGRVLCPQLLRSVLETRLGDAWAVSRPDPTKHAQRGCVFTASAT